MGRLLALLSLAFRSHQFYFSHAHDVTHTLQSLGTSARPSPAPSAPSPQRFSNGTEATNNGTSPPSPEDASETQAAKEGSEGWKDEGYARSSLGEGEGAKGVDGGEEGAEAAKEGLVRKLEAKFRRWGSWGAGRESSDTGQGEGVDGDDGSMRWGVERPSSLAPDDRFFWNLGILRPLLNFREDLVAQGHRHGLDPGSASGYDGVGSTNSSREARREGTGGGSFEEWARPSVGAVGAVAALDRWLTPVMSGFLQVERGCEAGQGGGAFDLLLVSRRSRLRQGTRYTRRGIDASGNVANFVETEQVCRIGLLGCGERMMGEGSKVSRHGVLSKGSLTNKWGP